MDDLVLDSLTMTLPIILGVLALALGVLSAVLTLLVGRRYHQINIANRKILGEFESVQKSHGQLHRSHTRRLNEIDPAIRLLEAQETQNSLVRESTGGIWSTGTGTKVQIRTMTDLHLANCIAWIEELPARERRRQQHREGLKMLRAEARRRRYGAKLEAEAQRTIEIEFKGLDTLTQFADAVGRSPLIAVDEGPTSNDGPFVKDPNRPLGPDEHITPSGNYRFTEHANGYSTELTVKGQKALQAWRDRQKPEPGIDWNEVDRILADLRSRTLMSRGICDDLAKVQHLLGRGRKS